jgi:hypothetical protein
MLKIFSFKALRASFKALRAGFKFQGAGAVSSIRNPFNPLNP